jgi:hypothetical protein
VREGEGREAIGEDIARERIGGRRLGFPAVGFSFYTTTVKNGHLRFVGGKINGQSNLI